MGVWRAVVAAALVLLVPAVAGAHGPSRQKVTVTTEVLASPAEVWAAIGDYQDMSWHPAVAASTGSGGNVPGAVRVLRLGAVDGPTLDEVLEKYSAEKMSYSYRITAVDVAVLPVTNYTSHLTVKPGAKGGALIEWRGAFYRGFPNNDPPPELNDEAAVKAVTGVYEAGMAALRAKFGAVN